MPMSASSKPRLLLTGATGFVGQSLLSALEDRFDVVCASRDPAAAHQRFPGHVWLRLDAGEPSAWVRALHDCRAVIYLIHDLAAAGDYEAREERAAAELSRAALAAGVERIVYLGGVLPRGHLSKHLRSRLTTGAVLRSGRVPVFELQAAMVIGAKSESWKIVRDLSVRLPIMLLPRWLEGRSQPIAIDDVVVAILHALELPVEHAGAYALPGPETLSAREILRRVAAANGLAPRMLAVPFVSPTLSSYCIAWATRANGDIARELVQGLKSNLTADDDGFWKLLPQHQRVPFDEAVRRALAAETATLPGSTRELERALKWLSRTLGRARP
jgi:uncharacterized protein YbjT (DUF2867 family)